MPEVRISTDGNSVAIRSEHPVDAWNAWAVMNRINGGHWAKDSQVETWDIVTATEPAPVPDPPEEPEPPLPPE